MSRDNGPDHKSPAGDEGFDLYDWRNAVASRQGPANDTTRLVLLVLSLHMNPQGVAWPSQDHLVQRTALGRRTVQRALERAESEGWIVRGLRTQPGRKWRLTQYRGTLPGYIDIREKPWEPGDCFRRSATMTPPLHERGVTMTPSCAVAGSLTAEPLPSVPPPDADELASSVHERGVIGATRWRQSCTDMASPWRTNSPENYPENSSREGALTRTVDQQGSDDTEPRSPSPNQTAANGKEGVTDSNAAIRRLLDLGQSPSDIVRVLSGRGVTLADVLALTRG